jgi:tRNA(His) guanylyltransferase
MSNIKLRDRIDAYSEITDYKLLNKLPVIITVNGRSFSKLTALLEKPFSNKLTECFCSTLLRLIQEIDGAIFGYHFNDEIIIVSRNDQHLETLPWYDNNLQKICSATSSMATLYFNNYASATELNLMGEAIFHTHIYTVPNITEAINVIVSKQQQAIQTSIYFSCFYELLKKYDKHDIKEMLAGTTIDDKINLLHQECGINFNDYSNAFRRGIACYRSPKVINYEGTNVIKNKWTLNVDVPIFTKEHSFLNQIFRAGTDILRKDDL